jgi:hypothetical protein
MGLGIAGVEFTVGDDREPGAKRGGEFGIGSGEIRHT